jgi:hypothetical protein
MGLTGYVFSTSEISVIHSSKSSDPLAITSSNLSSSKPTAQKSNVFFAHSAQLDELSG